ncbi:MAG: glutathione S-transferase family protein [Myxococcales bacterium]|nr:glutathione S-transferase [Myxococcales bacterium]HIK84835.1 glutathione S-transferase [Myxococcales bacterium]
MIPSLKATVGERSLTLDGRLWSLWASQISPFALKVDALCDYADLPHRWMPAEGSRLEGIRDHRRVRAITAGRLSLTFPKMSELDEFPLVPFLLGPSGENLYDSSAIGEWLTTTGHITRAGAAPLLPIEDDALRFAIHMVDEYFDEFGLYLAHHNRWKVSARDNNAGRLLADDMRPTHGPIARILERQFPSRQVKRLPYLFSVGEIDDHGFDDLPKRLRPPERKGFPPTHALLEEAFARLLAVIEALLADRPYLFGDRFTLADASVYGQLAMNLTDASAETIIRRDGPRVREWLQRIEEADFKASLPDGRITLDAKVEPLLSEIGRIFVPLMQQNAAAYERHRIAGETCFNEAGFDAGRALYDGELAGHPFRSVAKTFQVRVWQSLLEKWNALSESDRERLSMLRIEAI